MKKKIKKFNSVKEMNELLNTTHTPVIEVCDCLKIGKRNIYVAFDGNNRCYVIYSRTEMISILSNYLMGYDSKVHKHYEIKDLLVLEYEHNYVRVLKIEKLDSDIYKYITPESFAFYFIFE